MKAKVMFSSCGKTYFPGDSVDDLPEEKLKIAIEKKLVVETIEKEVINQSQKKKKKGKNK